MTRDVIDFPVVGTYYQRGPELTEALAKLREGMILDLEIEPGNVHDSYAIKVVFEGVQLGYVPNKGMSCKHCNSGVTAHEDYCSKCQATWDFKVKGGLAYRLHSEGLFLKKEAKVIALVKEIVDMNNQPIIATLILE